MSRIDTDFTSVQAHYDLNDDFFRLFLDPSLTYSCARFEPPDLDLAGAQRAKIETTLAKCELRPGLRLLDVGCGWGATALAAHDRYGVSVVGLTLSENQYRHDQRLAEGRPGMEFRLEGWETFDEPVDRIVSIGAFEHFGRAKYAGFFERCRGLLPDDGVLLVHTITLGRPTKAFKFLRFMHFLSSRIFPGGDVPPPERVMEAGRAAGFEPIHIESLRPHYARTLDCWAANLQAREAEAVALVGDQVYRTYIQYLTSCAENFRAGNVNVYQFKFRPSA